MIYFFKNPCNLYFTLWSVYLLQGTLYESGSLFSQAILLVILLVSLRHFGLSLLKKKQSLFFKSLSALLLMFIVYGTLHILFNGKYSPSITFFRPETTTYLKTYLISLLPIYSCYYYASKKHLNEGMFQYWIIFFFILAFSEYFRLQREVLDSFTTDREDITNNMGYVFVALFPCLMVLEKKPILQYIGAGICSVFALLAIKRGAMLLIAVSLVAFVLYKMRTSRGPKKLLFSIMVLLGVFLLSRFFENMMMNNEYFSQRIELTMSGDSSGRETLYSDFINAFLHDANLGQVLFGRGANGTLTVSYNYAHSDWLEILTNQGLFGVALFTFFWLSFYKTIKNGNYSQLSRFTLVLIIIVYGIKTIFSMSIGAFSIYTSSVLGYALADGFLEKGNSRRELNSYKYE